jgi:Uncharacterized conserved protein
MSDIFDFKKKYRDLYLPPRNPAIIDVPEIVCIAVSGKGDPNTSEAYKNALEVLYGFSYAIKMSKLSGNTPDGYFDFVVPPLEGFWSLDDGGFDYDGLKITDKKKFVWTSFLRQPAFVTQDVFEQARETLLKKKHSVDFTSASLLTFTEGLCVQIMHTGPYDTEAADIRLMDAFAVENGCVPDFSEERRHHEIYIGDPRKTAPEKLRTVIRHPVRKSA